MEMIQDIVIKEISKHIGCDENQISPEMRLDELGIDSLDTITMLYEFEDRYDLEIPNEVLKSFNVVNDIVVHLEQLLENKASQ
jgi:acyl carrier protein